MTYGGKVDGQEEQNHEIAVHQKSKMQFLVIKNIGKVHNN